MTTRKFLVSGISPQHQGGTGRLLRVLKEYASSQSYVFISRRISKSLRLLIKNKQLFLFIFELVLRVAGDTYFWFRVRRIKESEIILIQPQTIGFNLFFKLIKQNKVIKFYVVDNSFFCIRSYNYIKGEGKECLKCLDGLHNCDPRCVSSFKISRTASLKALTKLKAEFAAKIKFFAQNEGQASLLKAFFGDTIHCKVIGMGAVSLTSKQLEEQPEQFKTKTPLYRIIFHAPLLEVKGFLFINSLAPLLINCEIVIPNSKSNVVHEFPDHIFAPNLKFIPMTWEMGLKEEVQAADLVICPSLWSAPIEGALIKSLYWGRAVAVFFALYSFSNEISNNAIIRLTSDLDQSALDILKFLQKSQSEKQEKQYHARKYIKKLYSQMDLKSLFD
jgi:hypothetical protein